MLKFQLSSGKKVTIDYAPMDCALNLLRCVLNECKNAGLNLKIGVDTNLAELLSNNKEALLNIFSSEPVLEATQDCCTKVLYDNQKFNTDIFEDITNRQDYIPLLVLVALENLTPFFPQARIVLNPIQSLLLK